MERFKKRKGSSKSSNNLIVRRNIYIKQRHENILDYFSPVQSELSN